MFFSSFYGSLWQPIKKALRAFYKIWHNDRGQFSYLHSSVYYLVYKMWFYFLLILCVKPSSLETMMVIYTILDFPPFIFFFSSFAKFVPLSIWMKQIHLFFVLIFDICKEVPGSIPNSTKGAFLCRVWLQKIKNIYIFFYHPIFFNINIKHLYKS